MYRKGRQYYQGFSEERRYKLTPMYARLCAKVARVLLDKSHRSPSECQEAVQLLQESLEIVSHSADNWYRLGSALLECVMHSGVQTYRTHVGMVIPAYAGIQEVPWGGIPTGAGMTCILPFPLCIPGRRATVKMHNTL
jgi:hypothetical protein